MYDYLRGNKTFFEEFVVQVERKVCWRSTQGAKQTFTE